jgi:catechol 2,3-dioxygenase-like lactoylglutathione lyase family enzyme
MLGTARVIAFAATTNVTEARRFYERVLGLQFISEEPFALVFDANGTMLRLQKVERFTPPPFTALGWDVSDIEVVVDGLRARGVELSRYGGMAQDERGIWNAPGGARIAWFKDPDGNTLSLTQF